MLSMRSLYALKALTAIARDPGREVFMIAELAKEENIPRKFLEAILLALRKQGILTSKKGPGGGYSLAGSPRTLTIGRILNALEGEFSPLECLGNGNVCPGCTDKSACGIRLVMADVKVATSSILDTVTLADMLERSLHAQERRKGVIDYVI